jgi:hypothetical protein
MSVNRERSHLFVLPEDGADRQLAVEFWAQIDFDRQRQMYVLDEARGWIKVLDLFESVYVAEMDRWPKRYMVLLFDFDGEDRLNVAKARVPDHLADRVFILGAWTDPQALKAALGPSSRIGSLLATDCREGTDKTWGHELLRHNAGEINRLRRDVTPILFSQGQGA